MSRNVAPTVVEFIGGPLDGDRRAMPDDVQWYKVAMSPDLELFANDEIKLPPLRVALYRRRLGDRFRFDFEEIGNGP